MMHATRTVMTGAMAALLALSVGAPASANEPGYGKEGYGGSGHSSMGGHSMGMAHGGTGHFLRHLIKHQKEIGLSDEQVTKLKEMELNLDRTRIKAEADILVAEREHKALIEDEKSDLAAIEAKIKQSMDQQLALRMAVIKTKRDALALLTPEQRTKEKAEHEKMMQQHKDMSKGSGKGGNPHGAPQNPHGTNPHKGSGSSTAPAAPGSMSVQ
jgi:periplasmic protein CpxP/Spy